MDWWIWVLIALGAVVAVVLILGMYGSSRRRAGLRDRFGPEYERAVDDAGDRRGAERELREREERRSEVELHPLAPKAREGYEARWRELQGHFVDRPQVAVADADRLITDVMRDLGYPVDYFDSKAALISVDHPEVVIRYREAHDIYTKTVEGTATTEDLRQAVISYRALFEELMRESVETEN